MTDKPGLPLREPMRRLAVMIAIVRRMLLTQACQLPVMPAIGLRMYIVERLERIARSATRRLHFQLRSSGNNDEHDRIITVHFNFLLTPEICFSVPCVSILSVRICQLPGTARFVSGE